MSDIARHRSVHGKYFSINMPAVLVINGAEFEIFRWSLAGLDAYGKLHTEHVNKINAKVVFNIDFYSISFTEMCQLIYTDDNDSSFGVSFIYPTNNHIELLLTFMRAYMQGHIAAISSRDCSYLGPQPLSPWELPNDSPLIHLIHRAAIQGD